MTIQEAMRVLKRANGTGWVVGVEPQDDGYIVTLDGNRYDSPLLAIQRIAEVLPNERDNTRTLAARSIARKAIEDALAEYRTEHGDAVDAVIAGKLARYALVFAPINERPEPKRRKKAE